MACLISSAKVSISARIHHHPVRRAFRQRMESPASTKKRQGQKPDHRPAHNPDIHKNRWVCTG